MRILLPSHLPSVLSPGLGGCLRFLVLLIKENVCSKDPFHNRVGSHAVSAGILPRLNCPQHFPVSTCERARMDIPSPYGSFFLSLPQDILYDARIERHGPILPPSKVGKLL